MTQYRKTNDLYHHGVKGMKWGVRRTPQQLGHDIRKRRAQKKAEQEAYKKKMRKIAKNRYNLDADKKRARYSAQSTTGKVISTTATTIGKTIVRDAMLGKSYSKMTPQQLAAKAVGMVAETGARYAYNEATAKSMASRYTEDGKRKPRTKTEYYTKEQKMDLAVDLAMAALPLAAYSAKTNIKTARANRAANEAKFNAWGGNILEMKFDDIVGMSDDEWRVIK